MNNYAPASPRPTHEGGGQEAGNGLRIAMWSGPRNISTAMMRSWENRPDTWVVDEPLYAHYLTQVPVAHPGVDEVIAHHESDWRKVVAEITGPMPHGRTIYYQKHMAHHWLPHLRGDWLLRLGNAFLIRHPAEMLPSLTAKNGTPGPARHRPAAAAGDLPVRARPGPDMIPPVLDAEDVLRDPA